MKKYVLLVADRRTPCDDRHWVIRTTLEDAQNLAREYERNNENLVEIYEITTNLRYE